LHKVDAVVIGAGVVGLAVARALSRAGHEVLILDGERQFGSWTSSRNSGVIHAGIYYAPGSLKAELCVEGRERLYRFCAAHKIPHQRLGKLIFAQNATQSAALDAILRTAQAADVRDLVRLSSAEAARLEPALNCTDALLSPSTGIVDQHQFMLALLADAEAHNATLVCNSRIGKITRQAGNWGLHLDDAAEPALHARLVVNAAGLAAQSLARATEGLAADKIPPLHLARGVYFTYTGKTPFRHLIYPVPEPGGLGTHLTLDLSGQARFGPDVEWINNIDYSVDPGRHAKFVSAARRIWPELDPARLQPGYAGIRPKLSGPGARAADFRIDGESAHGLPGLVNLFGIESPGLTAALAIAERVARLLE